MEVHSANATVLSVNMYVVSVTIPGEISDEVTFDLKTREKRHAEDDIISVFFV